MTTLPFRGPQVAYAAIVLLMLAWNVRHAGTAVQLQRGSPWLRGLTGLNGLLVIPAFAIALTSASALTGRATSVVAWAWPLTTLLFVAHSVAAVAQRLTRPALGVPLVLFNLAVGASASAQYANANGWTLPSAAGAAGLASASTLGLVFGRDALLSPWALMVPVLAPVVPARYRRGRAAAGLLALATAAVTLLTLAEYPRAIEAWQSFGQFSADRLQERPGGDFLLGLRILPEIERAPSPGALRGDLTLIDSLGLDAVQVYVTPDGTRGTALDSVSRALDDLRRDSTLILLSLGYDARDGRLAARDPAAYARARLEAVDRAVRRLRPDVLLPARDPGSLGVASLGELPATWWRQFLGDAAARARQLRPRTRVGVSVAAFTPFDSALFRWAQGSDSPLDLVGFTLAPSYGGGHSLEARLRVAGQWSREAGRPMWVFATGANPRLFGEANQALAAWGVLSWATTLPRIQGVVIDGAADYDAIFGLRAPDGHLRSVVATLDRAQRSLAEVATVKP